MNTDEGGWTQMGVGRASEVVYLVAYEFCGANWSAYSPDVPGCAATGATREEVETRYREALEFHIEGLRLHGEAVPVPTAQAGLVTVAA